MPTKRDIQMRRHWHAADIMKDGIDANESEPASNRSESEPTAEEWAIAEQRAGEARMEADDDIHM